VIWSAVLIGWVACTGLARADVLLDAAEVELQRAMDGFVGDANPPYWMAISIVEGHRIEVEATHGSAGHIVEVRRRLADVDVRVGSPQIDNTHKIRDGGFDLDDMREPIVLPIEDDAFAIQVALWKALDGGHDAAVRRLIKVHANDAIKVAREDRSDDFSLAPARVDVQPLVPLEVDGEHWKAVVRQLSARFTSHPEIYDSNVSFRVEDETRRVVNTEGTRVRHQRHRVRLAIWASTVAEDGMRLSVYDHVDAADVAHVPDAAVLDAMADAVIEKLVALRHAPMVEPYVGPAILRGRAAAVFFHEILGHRVEGHRQKDEDEGQTVTDKVGEAIFPSFISVADDPTLLRWGGQDLNGSYAYDDEGVPAERVQIVEDGVLRGFLMSRAPVEGFGRSNGHGRRQPGAAIVARQGNLMVSASETMPYATLRARLLAEVRAQGRPFGLIFDDISGGFTFTGRSTPNSYAVQPVTVYRVWADGRPDQLVRGVDLIGTPLTTFERSVAASDQTQVFNGICGAESGWVPVAAVAPDLLVSEVEVQRREKGNNRPPLRQPPPGVEGAP